VVVAIALRRPRFQGDHSSEDYIAPQRVCPVADAAGTRSNDEESRCADGDLIPTDWTEAALRSACGFGDVIEVGAPMADDPTAAIAWINARFDAAPATNDCAALSYPAQSYTGG
jgi:hypothetical protein